MIRSFLFCLALSGPAFAGGAEDFVTANVISTLYHEFGHALIDITEAPVLGREEDAADTLSVVLLDAFWEEEFAQNITAYTALSFELAADEAEDPAYWDVHSLDLQRYYNQICLFYGGNPDQRAGLAKDFELPDEREATCVREFDLAAASWGGILEPLETAKPGKSLVFTGDRSSDIGTLLSEEVAAINEVYALPRRLSVALASCGEENAFYDPATARITICTEFVDFLKRQAKDAGL